MNIELATIANARLWPGADDFGLPEFRKGIPESEKAIREYRMALAEDKSFPESLIFLRESKIASPED